MVAMHERRGQHLMAALIAVALPVALFAALDRMVAADRRAVRIVQGQRRTAGVCVDGLRDGGMRAYDVATVDISRSRVDGAGVVVVATVWTRVAGLAAFGKTIATDGETIGVGVGVGVGSIIVPQLCV